MYTICDADVAEILECAPFTFSKMIRVSGPHPYELRRHKEEDKRGSRFYALPVVVSVIRKTRGDEFTDEQLKQLIDLDTQRRNELQNEK